MLCRICGWPSCTEFLEWSWYFVDQIASLKDPVINLDKCFEDWDGKSQCLMSIDCTDCMINEPWPWSKQWYSQKFNSPAIKYEVDVCIGTGHIEWINGPFEASANDATIAIQGLLTKLADDEGVEMDGIYKGNDKFKGP